MKLALRVTLFVTLSPIAFMSPADAMVSRIAEMPSGKIVAGRSVNIALDELSPVPHSVVLRQIFFGVGGLMSVGERANDHDLPNDQ